MLFRNEHLDVAEQLSAILYGKAAEYGKVAIERVEPGLIERLSSQLLSAPVG
jgi:hypothetical protein